MLASVITLFQTNETILFGLAYACGELISHSSTLSFKINYYCPQMLRIPWIFQFWGWIETLCFCFSILVFCFRITIFDHFYSTGSIETWHQAPSPILILQVVVWLEIGLESFSPQILNTHSFNIDKNHLSLHRIISEYNTSS